MSKMLLKSISKALTASVVAVGLAAVVFPLTPVRAQDAAAKAEAASGLAGVLSQRGKASVIVRLSGDYQPEHVLAGPDGVESSTAVAIQRAAIRQSQDRVLANLAGTSVSATKYFKYTPLMSMSVDASGLQALVDSPDVVSIYEDRPVPPALADSVPLIGGNVSTGFPLGIANFTGAGQTIAILDTGVQSSHPFLTGKVVSEACYSTSSFEFGSSTVCPGGFSETTAPGSGVNCDLAIMHCDHGTHVAGIAAGNTIDISGRLHSGVAKGANLIAIQVFSEFDETFCGVLAPCALSYDSDQIKGLERVYELRITYNIAAVNMSLGGDQYAGFCDDNPTKPIIDLLRSVGIATVIASGNDGYANAVGAPACISSAVTVGSTTKTDEVSSFSNNSPVMIDFLAPGSAITSSVPLGGYASWDGTSMGTPHVAAAFAVLKESKPGAAVSDLELALRATGTTVSETRSGVYFAKRRINVALALAFEPADSVAADFNADTMSDILFRNLGSGGTVVWQMNGMAKESSAVIGNPPTSWRIEEVGDFNSDGHSDILWRNTSSRATVIWLMDGYTRIDSGQIGSIHTVWRIEGLGDFDGDGSTDILWRHSGNGSTSIWLMNEFTKLNSQSIGAPSTSWQIAAIVDYNGDGKSDIVWRNTSGSILLWLMDGFTRTATASLGNPGSVWQVEGVADFEGDGQPDFLFRNTGDSRIVTWQMNGYLKQATAVIGRVSGDWQVVRLGDHNGDGMADILWNRPSTGQVVIWQMNGSLVREASALVGSPGGWVAQ